MGKRNRINLHDIVTKIIDWYVDHPGRFELDQEAYYPYFPLYTNVYIVICIADEENAGKICCFADFTRRQVNNSMACVSTWK